MFVKEIIINLILILVIYYSKMTCISITVSTSGQLHDAINSVRPGDVILINNGTYSGAFRLQRNGNPNAMIVLEGSSRALISNKLGIALYLRSCNYWHIKGFTIANSRKGIVMESSNNNVVDNLIIENIDEEGMHLFDGSSDNVIRDCGILMTGIKSTEHGEAIVIGRDYRQWLARNPDKSDRNIIINNRFGPQFSNEAVVLNEGTCCGLLARNQFDGNGMSDKNGYGCWVKIKGDRYRIEHNRGVSTVSEGFMVMSQKLLNMGGCDNVFTHNYCVLQSDGYCIKVLDAHNCGNVVYSDNGYNTGRALTNIAITRQKRFYKYSFITDQINLPLIVAFTFLPTLFIILALIVYFLPQFH